MALMFDAGSAVKLPPLKGKTAVSSVSRQARPDGLDPMEILRQVEQRMQPGSTASRAGEQLRRVEQIQQPPPPSKSVELLGPPLPPKPEDFGFSSETAEKTLVSLQRQYHRELPKDTAFAYFDDPEGGAMAYYAEGPTDEGGKRHGTRIGINLSSLQNAYKLFRSRPNIPMGQYIPRETQDEFLARTIKHEVAHAIQSWRESKASPGNREELKRQPTPDEWTGLRATWQDQFHNLGFDLANRQLAGYGAEPRFSNIGLPREYVNPVLERLWGRPIEGEQLPPLRTQG